MANFKVGAARDLSIDKTSSWDGSAAEASIFSWAGFDGDSPDSAKARRGFMVYDASAPDLRGSYKLPFAKVSGGKLVAVAAGVKAADSRLSSTQGLSSGVKAEVQGIIDAYEKKAGMNDDKATEITIGEELIEESASGLSVVRIGQLTRAISTDEVRAALEDNPLYDASAFEGQDPYGWTVEASNTQMDTFYTHMLPSTLKNYAADAMNNGVPFQHAHDDKTMPIGRSVRGQYMGGSNPRTMIDFYSFPNVGPTELTSDRFMVGVKAGVYRDVSVGFYGGNYICDACGRALMTYECSHFPGMKYDANAEDGRAKGKKPNMVRATAGIDDAHLAEVSTVYHGSCPGAVVMKARGLAAIGELRPEMAGLIEAQYRILLPRSSKRFQGISMQTENTSDENVVELANEDESAIDSDQEVTEEPTTALEDTKERAMETNKDTNAQVEERVVEKIVEREIPAKPVRALELVAEEVRAELTDLGVTEEMDAARAVAVLMAKVRALKPAADDGVLYREQCITDAVEAAVRVFGEETDVERYRNMLSRESIETIRLMTTDWNKKSGDTFKAGRQTTEGEEAGEKPVSKGAKAPNHVFAS